MLNDTPIGWISKLQKIVETSTYVSELVASKIAKELTLEVSYMFWSSGISLDKPALMLGDNMLVILNTIVPSSVLKNKHNPICISSCRRSY
jgi:hypothetical protein